MRPNPNHKYKVGQKIRFFQVMSPLLTRTEAAEPHWKQYEVTRLLPQDGNEFQYRIKECSKGLERVVRESEIG